MIMKQCVKGHWYDESKFPSCPFCKENRTPDFSSSAQVLTVPGETEQRCDTTASLFSQTGSNLWNGNHAGMDSVTQPLTDDPLKKDTEVTQPAFSPVGNKEGRGSGAVLPVTGWIVCIGGPNKGMDYRITPANNRIGRLEGDIILKGDEAISRKEMATITYVHQENTFYIQPGSEAKNYIRLNNKFLPTSAPLAAYDRIEIGNSEFIFVPFCSDRFQWQQEEK